ncbi:MAG TPA: homogentisate 1,2-dioxygenase [Chloroflexota bacterium]|jgi:homogentisate 1,2-dioxygenase
MAEMNGAHDGARPVMRWTREGFTGDSTRIERPHYTPEYTSVEGPHAPHRLRLDALAPADRADPAALPTPVLAARSGFRLSVSGRAAPMPFALTNVEADEVHFVQEGALAFATDHGTLRAGPGDFVCIPRAITYCVEPLRTPTLSVLLEMPGAVSLGDPALWAGDVERPAFDAPSPADGEAVVLVKAFDGITRYVRPHDPLARLALREGLLPIWKLNLRRLLVNRAGPPNPFAASRDAAELLYNLSANPRGRPPIHVNADYDEVIYYFAGPGAWGAVREPGTLTWVPKGIPHHGPQEDVPEGYLAWLLDSRGTLRLTPAGHTAAELMETGQYGRHPSVAAEPVGAGAA